MEKTKYRYKCMICGTEVVSAKDVLSCSACGSDELAKFEIEIAPVIDITEKKPAKKPRRRKAERFSVPDSGIESVVKDSVSVSDLLKDLDPLPSSAPMPAYPPPRRPSIHIPPPPPPPPPPLTMTDRAWNFLGKIKWKVLLRVVIPLGIGSAIYGIVKMFI